MRNMTLGSESLYDSRDKRRSGGSDDSDWFDDEVTQKEEGAAVSTNATSLACIEHSGSAMLCSAYHLPAPCRSVTSCPEKATMSTRAAVWHRFSGPFTLVLAGSTGPWGFGEIHGNP